MGQVVTAMAFPVPDNRAGRAALEVERESVHCVSTRTGERLPVLYLRRGPERSKYTLLFSHGNAEDLGLCVRLLQHLSGTLECDVVAYEYCGYGIAEGTPTERGCYASIDEAFRYMTVQAEIPAREIIVVGRSLGSGPSVYLAARTPGLAALVLISPLESGVRVVVGKSGSNLLRPLDIFPNYRRMKRVDCPVLVVHGEKDEVVPFSHGKTLCDLAPRAVDPLWIPDAGHNNIPPTLLLNRLAAFIEKDLGGL